MESSAVSTPNNLYSSGSLCLICGKSFIFMEINSSGETILNKQGLKRKLRVTDENSQKYFEVLQERLDIKKERAARNGICTKCMVKIDSVLRMRKESERLTNELESLRKATKERSLKDESPKGNSQFTATSSSSSSTDARPVEIRRKRLLRSPQFPPAKIKYQAIRPKPVMFDESKKDKKSLKEDSRGVLTITQRNYEH
ncbi:hypothetical protein LOTGIDRAFT_154692 [Lottia gigantea]|uniref:Uncharacterized protein n=1 Tax=Lottia gigantea TaxID=225164 RepID=V3Z8G1_LOTGI|nr:hypothetical protein LOTGIDRAFT_154692 [Lottia gigantea]ESO87188.1 hypothetical protein LOTGIDRAFT_154692 [Lottia gigantea]